MDIFFYDTRQRKKVQFKPLEPGIVKLYTCGPTVYTDSHIGNYRTFIFEDLLRRSLEFFGYRVTQVMNLTDVDDKTIRNATENGVSLKEFTAPIIERFFRDIADLNIQPADHYPAATDHIPEMIDLIKKLLEKGYAYIADGSVYFSIEKYAEYGKLSGMKIENMVRGSRIDADEYEKDDFRDFALWRGASEADGDVHWDAPFGSGRPGWHIECSAMSMHYLGEQFDIHTGGVDNIFPHHENEIAQSVCATGNRFVHYWMHSTHLLYNGEKMSKSLGNIATFRELASQGYAARSIRYVLLTTHYRQQLNFSKDAIKAAEASLVRLDTLRQAVSEATDLGNVRAEVESAIILAEKNFSAGLADDLGISAAIAALYDLVSAIHRIAQKSGLRKTEGEQVLQFWKKADSVLAFLFPGDDFPINITKLVKERIIARAEKNWELSDKLRLELSKYGYELEDSLGGTTVSGSEGRVLVK